jgi:hypothetical protein
MNENSQFSSFSPIYLYEAMILQKVNYNDQTGMAEKGRTTEL